MYCAGKTSACQKRRFASSVLHSCNVKTQICVTRPQCVNKTKLVKLNSSLGEQRLRFLTYYLVIISNNDLKFRPTSVCQMSQTGRYYSALLDQRSLKLFINEKGPFISELTANANLSETFDQKWLICWLRVHTWIERKYEYTFFPKRECPRMSDMFLALTDFKGWITSITTTLRPHFYCIVCHTLYFIPKPSASKGYIFSYIVKPISDGLSISRYTQHPPQ